MPGTVMTIERYIVEEERAHPEATGVLTSLLYDVALAGKLISRETNRAGLAEILGLAGITNIQGEQVAKLDIFANETIKRLNSFTGRLAAMASEEEENIIHVEEHPTASYILLFDPLDGSSNIDYSVSVGTIFGVYRRKSQEGPVTLEDCLQPGRNLVAAGYIIYGSSTILVYSTGNGVHGFTLDTSVGEFLLSHPNIQVPPPTYYSVNQGYETYWSAGVQHFTRYLQSIDDESFPKGLSMRYIGSLVADFHRNLLAGGIFYYPADTRDPKKPHGKLRLVYEAAPLAFLIKQAGGYASDGCQSILDIKPADLHQRTPLFIGNKNLVEKAEEFIAKYDNHG